MGAEKVFIEKEKESKIVVEIKVFGGKSKTTEFEKAKGQYDIYLFALRKNQVDRLLFLAIPDEVYQQTFLRPSIRDIVAEEKMNLLIFNPKTEEITRWINWQDTAA